MSSYSNSADNFIKTFCPPDFIHFNPQDTITDFLRVDLIGVFIMITNWSGILMSDYHDSDKQQKGIDRSKTDII